MKTWHRAVLREALFDLPKGTVVAVRQTKLIHTAIEKTFWILSIKHNRLYHVADTVAGSGCQILCRIDVQASNQERCEEHARRNREKGQYAKSRRKEIKELLKRKEK